MSHTTRPWTAVAFLALLVQATIPADAGVPVPLPAATIGTPVLEEAHLGAWTLDASATRLLAGPTRITADTIRIDGTLAAAPALQDGAAIELVARTAITVAGRILGADGASHGVQDTAVALDGGDGSSILLRAPVITILPGAVLQPGLGGKGGDAIPQHLPEGGTVRGGDGGDGGWLILDATSGQGLLPALDAAVLGNAMGGDGGIAVTTGLRGQSAHGGDGGHYGTVLSTLRRALPGDDAGSAGMTPPGGPGNPGTEGPDPGTVQPEDLVPDIKVNCSETGLCLTGGNGPCDGKRGADAHANGDAYAGGAAAAGGTGSSGIVGLSGHDGEDATGPGGSGGTAVGGDGSDGCLGGRGGDGGDAYANGGAGQTGGAGGTGGAGTVMGGAGGSGGDGGMGGNGGKATGGRPGCGGVSGAPGAPGSAHANGGAGRGGAGGSGGGGPLVTAPQGAPGATRIGATGTATPQAGCVE